ncbi:MAG: hypothetical protein KDB69_05925 [Acidimicrobiia bacterium]|nr:hypothetical protein [Acidimicrobiia bacterium]
MMTTNKTARRPVTSVTSRWHRARRQGAERAVVAPPLDALGDAAYADGPQSLLRTRRTQRN